MALVWLICMAWATVAAARRGHPFLGLLSGALFGPFGVLLVYVVRAPRDRDRQNRRIVITKTAAS